RFDSCRQLHDERTRTPSMTEGNATRAEDGAMSFSDGEWRMIRATRPNILTIGTADAVESAVAALVARLPGSVSYLRPNAPPPAADDAEMLFMPDVAALSPDRQDEWVTWLSSMDVRRPQIVATSGVPVYPLVEADQFSGV